MIRDGRLPISSGGGMSDPLLPGGTGDRDGFLGASGFGDLSRMTSIFGVGGDGSGALISGTFGFSAGYN